jgi:hypothetical protein
MFGVSEIPDWQYVVDPHWRSYYEVPRWVYDIAGKDASISTLKAVEILNSFAGEFIDKSTACAIRSKLLPFFGDRNLQVRDYISFNDVYILVEFDDDTGYRQTLRIS